jgi:phytepsin
LLQLCERLPSPNGESMVDCNSLSAMPPVSFTIAGKDFKLTPEQVCIQRFIDTRVILRGKNMEMTLAA